MYQVTQDFRINRTGELLKKGAETNAEQFRPDELERALTRGYLVANEELDDTESVADTSAKLELKTEKELETVADTEGVADTSAKLELKTEKELETVADTEGVDATRAKLSLKTVEQLKALAVTEGVDLTGAKNKTEIIDRFIG